MPDAAYMYKCLEGRRAAEDSTHVTHAVRGDNCLLVVSRST